MTDKYVLNADRTVSKMDDVVEWSRRFETDDRRIAYTQLLDGRIVSTAFLGINHRYGRGGPPLLFETMIFPSSKNFDEEWVERCSTYQQALSQHARGVAEAERLGQEGVSNTDTPTER